MPSLLSKIKNIPPDMNIENACSVTGFLVRTLWDKIPGDVVELGCHKGLTSMFIQLELPPEKTFHVYDSFEGLPEPTESDGDAKNKGFVKGALSVTQEEFENNFISNDIKLPVIHKGRFDDISAEDMPKSISFAFLDSDLYESITRSLYLVYYNMMPGGIIVIHDYGHPDLPGVKKACDNFMKKRQESINIDGPLGFIIKEG